MDEGERMKRGLKIVIGIVVVLAALGVGFAVSFRRDAPISTESLLARFMASGNADNLHGTAEATLNVSVGTYRVTVPITGEVKLDGNAAHGTLRADLSSLGVQDYDCEFYVEQADGSIELFLGSGGQGSRTWTRTPIETTSEIDLAMVIDLLQASELTLVSTDKDEAVAYELTIPVTAVMDAVVGVLAEQPDYGGMRKDVLWSELEGDKIEVGFTKDCLAHSVTASMMFDYKSATTSAPTITIDVDSYGRLDGYGETDQAEVSVPQQIRDVAQDTTEPVDVVQILGADNPIAKALPTDMV